MRVIKQPDNLYAVWEDDVQDFVVWDATADDIDTYVVQKAILVAQEEAMQLIAKAEMSAESTFEEKLAIRDASHGQVSLDELEYRQWVDRWKEEG